VREGGGNDGLLHRRFRTRGTAPAEVGEKRGRVNGLQFFFEELERRKESFVFVGHEGVG